MIPILVPVVVVAGVPQTVIVDGRDAELGHGVPSAPRRHDIIIQPILILVGDHSCLEIFMSKNDRAFGDAGW